MSQDTIGLAADIQNKLPTAKTVNAATNATPIVVTTTTAHELNTGEVFTISGVTGNTAANGTFIAGTVTSNTVVLTAFPGGTNVAGSGAYVSGGTLQSLGFGLTVPVPNDLTDAMRAGAVNVPFEALLDFTAYLMYRAGPSGVIEQRVSDVQIFTSSGTWTKPTAFTPKDVEVLIVAPGGGGGSGARQNNVTSSSGGAGGGGGGVSRWRCQASDLTSTVTVTIGAPGAAGAAITTDDTVGAAGGDAGDVTFGAYVQATGGKGGGGGLAAAGTAAGGAGGTGDLPGGAGGDAAVGANGSAGVSATGAPGGGGGGGIAGGTTAKTGGAGGLHYALPGTAATGGAATGATGGTGTSSGVHGAGHSGGGGGSATGVTGGTGGVPGIYGAGGAGGGASVNGSNSGAGRIGAVGVCVVITSP